MIPMRTLVVSLGQEQDLEQEAAPLKAKNLLKEAKSHAHLCWTISVVI